jgi:thiol-disulfide isomerase/thioredoxin
VSAAEQYKNNPDDMKAFTAWLNETFKEISELMDSAPEDAEKKLAAAKEFAAALKPESATGKSNLTRVKLIATNFEESLALSRVTLADLEKQVDEKPNDLDLLRKYSRKVALEIGSIARTEPEKAEGLVSTVKERVAKLKEATEENATKTQLEALDRSLASFASAIKQGYEFAAMIGKPAPELNIEEWTNGSPLSADDLKGKVVLLDFWAIWCGPCIATFPHLREWQEKYSEKGLVIVGMTRYYGYEWDDATKRPMRPMKKPVEKKEGEDKEADKEPIVTHEAEQAMLLKFADFHGLKHRFALQGEGNSVAKQLAVQGIPQAVLIDRQGNIRLIRVGSGSKNAKALHDMIEKLLVEKPAAAK